MIGERMDLPYTVEPSVGRLIEARVFRLVTREDADEYSRALSRVVSSMAGVAPVLCADHRPVRVYPQAPADRLAELFTHMNSRLESVAILISPTNATLGLQLDRIVREVKNDQRRAFRSTSDALAHLGSSLNDREMAQASRFLASWTD